MKSETVNRWREAHHASLETLTDKGDSGLKIWRTLRRLEQSASRITTMLCNGEIEQDRADLSLGMIGQQVRSIVPLAKNFFINRDPRGYALKLDPEQGPIPEGMHTDWGRYGILAAQID
jgi:hypothetical protein